LKITRRVKISSVKHRLREKKRAPYIHFSHTEQSTEEDTRNISSVEKE